MQVIKLVLNNCFTYIFCHWLQTGVCAVAGAICSIATAGMSWAAGLALAGGLLTIGSGLCWYASTYDIIELGVKSNGKGYAKGIC